MKTHKYSSIDIPKKSAVYGDRWQAWWRALQPVWRTTNSDSKGALKLNDHMFLPPDEEWETLSIGGVDGILLAIIGLGLWAESVNTYKGPMSRKQGTIIDEAVKDLNLILEMMITNIQMKSERKLRMNDSTAVAVTVIDEENISNGKSRIWKGKARASK